MNKVFFLFFLCVFATQSYAGELRCGGSVVRLGLHAPDRFMLQLSSMNTAVFICNPSATWQVSGTPYTTSAETCKMMMSMLMHAKAANLQLEGVWFDGSIVPSSCTSWPAWESANVRHFLY